MNCGKNLRALAFGRVAPTRSIIDVTAHTQHTHVRVCVVCESLEICNESCVCCSLHPFLSLAWLDKTAKASASVLAHSKIVLEFLSFFLIDLDFFEHNRHSAMNGSEALGALIQT